MNGSLVRKKLMKEKEIGRRSITPAAMGSQ
jgi:hypothetical protein